MAISYSYWHWCETCLGNREYVVQHVGRALALYKCRVCGRKAWKVIRLNLWDHLTESTDAAQGDI